MNWRVHHGATWSQSSVWKPHSLKKDQMHQIMSCMFGYGQWLHDTLRAFVFHLWLSRCVRMSPSEIYAHSFTAPPGWPYYVSHHKSMTHTVNWQNPLRLNERSSSAACLKKKDKVFKFLPPDCSWIKWCQSFSGGYSWKTSHDFSAGFQSRQSSSVVNVSMRRLTWMCSRF